MTISDDDLLTRVGRLLADVDPSNQFEFRGAQFDAGLALVHFPEGKGGLGIERHRQLVVDEALRAAGVQYHDLAVNPIGIGMGAPTVLTYGVDDLHERTLRPLFTGEEIWCQLFSEPTHGSDVAGIASRAVRDGDEWIVNGQKVWSTLAHRARWGLLLVRTDPDVPKHRGLSYFVLDMKAPGVEVRPLYQITGHAEFNEVFLTDVRVGAHMMLGAEGDGWRVATTTLMNERLALGGSAGRRAIGPIRTLTNLWNRQRDRLSPALHATYRDRVTRLMAESEVLRLTNQRAKAGASSGNPGPESSIGKLMSAELNQRIATMCIDLLGADGMLYAAGYTKTRPEEGHTPTDPGGLFLRSRANTIEGGTSEIMRNILAERVLGLPGEPRVDRDVPWHAIPR